MRCRFVRIHAFLLLHGLARSFIYIRHLLLLQLRAVVTQAENFSIVDCCPIDVRPFPIFIFLSSSFFPLSLGIYIRYCYAAKTRANFVLPPRLISNEIISFFVFFFFFFNDTEFWYAATFYYPIPINRFVRVSKGIRASIFIPSIHIAIGFNNTISPSVTCILNELVNKHFKNVYHFFGTGFASTVIPFSLVSKLMLKLEE